MCHKHYGHACDLTCVNDTFLTIQRFVFYFPPTLFPSYCIIWSFKSSLSFTRLEFTHKSVLNNIVRWFRFAEGVNLSIFYSYLPVKCRNNYFWNIVHRKERLAPVLFFFPSFSLLTSSAILPT